MRSYRHLSAEDRETVSLAQGHSLRTMASVLGLAPSTVSRELARNMTRGRPYRAGTAHSGATGRGFVSRGGYAPSTDDRGKERAEPTRLAERRAFQGCVVDPYSPWPRGTHEHTRGCCASTGPRAPVELR